jgi:hypothetical protein
MVQLGDNSLQLGRVCQFKRIDNRHVTRQALSNVLTCAGEHVKRMNQAIVQASAWLRSNTMNFDTPGVPEGM